MLEFSAILGIEYFYVMKLMDEHPDNPEQSLVEVIHHWLQKHPQPDWMKLESAMDQIVKYPFHHSQHTVHRALQTLRKEYEG